MWLELAGVAVGLLGVAVAGDWLVRGRARRIGRIKAEAEVLQLLPESSAREALARKIETDVISHLDLTASAPARRNRALSAGILIGGVAAAPVAVGPALTEFFTDETVPDWMTVASGAAFVLLGFLTLAMVALVRVENQRRDESQDEAAQEVKVTHLVGEYRGRMSAELPRMTASFTGRYEEPHDATREVLEDLAKEVKPEE